MRLTADPGPARDDSTTSWRVNRIRDGSVVVVREDPANATAAPETRVLAMRAEGDPASARELRAEED